MFIEWKYEIVFLFANAEKEYYVCVVKVVYNLRY